MYKRKKRRATKGKKKLSIAATSSASAARTTSELSVDELVQNGETTETTETSDNMSVTTMEVAEEGEQQQVQPQRPSLDQTTSNNNSNNKAVGARKRKPMQISKIVDKRPQTNDHPIDFGAEKNLIHNNNNNNSPPYKKPCLELSKNGMIKNILSELKTAKMGGGNNNKGDTSMTRRLYERDEDDDDDDEEEDRSEDETLRIKVDDDEDDGDDDEEEGIDYSGNEDAKFVHNKRNNLYNVSPSSSSSSSFKDRYGAGSSMKDHHHHQQDREGSSHNNRIENTKRSILSNNMFIHKNINNNDNTGFKSPGKSRVSSPNDWDRNVLLDKDDDSVKDEGTDLRSVNGNSAGDDELPFRCGACTYSSCDKSTLIRHLRIHSGERPFQCRLCYFAFTTKANCERHLRNRHGQQIDSREQLRDLVVCLPTSSNASESETEMNSNGGGAQQSYPSMALLESNKRRGSNGSGMLVAEENELPLDLSMDAVDLSTHSKQRDGGNSIFRRKASLPRPRPMYAANEMSNSLVTSPFISKREPMVHPQLQLNSFASHPIASQTPVIGAHPNHPAFSLFPFGGPPGFNPFVIPTPTNVEKLMGLRSSSPTKISNYITASPKGSFENLVSRDPISAEKESKVKVEPATESKRSGSNSKSASSSSVSPTTSSRKRADNNNTNGDGYQKPKQRRYRTERPYSCPFCPARFTLRSNMERHGKHQHPTCWVRSPSNRVINRQKNQQQLSPLIGSPTLVQPNKKYNSNNSIGAENSNKDKNNKDSAVNVNVRAVIAQQLKRKLSNSSLRNNNNGSETETDPENTPVHDGKNSEPDLASVSQLLDRVKNSNFAQYFNEAENHNFNNDNNNNSEDELEGDESGEEDGLSDERSADEGDSKTSGGVEKKKSAYSSSPHKISCPHCPRRFPWTSSLRRHLLTHTGQKPFQCSKCPLLFTTKSNCDRHLARKHNNNNSNNNSKGTSDSNNSSEDEDEDEEDENEESVDCKGEETNNNNNSSSNNNNNTNNDEVVDNNASLSNSANNSSSNLLKTPIANSGTPTTSNSNSSSPAEDAAFRCHLCEAAAGEREALLTHMEEQHKETFHLLVSKGALSSSPQSDQNSENEQVPLDQKDVTHRKVMCVFCCRRFWSVEDLRRHIRSHSGERPFSCTHCNRRFTLKHSMLRHLKKHSTSVTPSRKLAKASKEQTDVASGTRAASSGKNNGDLIGRLLGIKDDHIEQLLSSDAKNAEKLLGLEKQQHAQQTRATSKVN